MEGGEVVVVDMLVGMAVYGASAQRVDKTWVAAWMVGHTIGPHIDHS